MSPFGINVFGFIIPLDMELRVHTSENDFGILSKVTKISDCISSDEQSFIMFNSKGNIIAVTKNIFQRIFNKAGFTQAQLQQLNVFLLIPTIEQIITKQYLETHTEVQLKIDSKGEYSGNNFNLSLKTHWLAEHNLDLFDSQNKPGDWNLNSNKSHRISNNSHAESSLLLYQMILKVSKINLLSGEGEDKDEVYIAAISFIKEILHIDTSTGHKETANTQSCKKSFQKEFFSADKIDNQYPSFQKIRTFPEERITITKRKHKKKNKKRQVINSKKSQQMESNTNFSSGLKSIEGEKIIGRLMSRKKEQMISLGLYSGLILWVIFMCASSASTVMYSLEIQSFSKAESIIELPLAISTQSANLVHLIHSQTIETPFKLYKQHFNLQKQGFPSHEASEDSSFSLPESENCIHKSQKQLEIDIADQLNELKSTIHNLIRNQSFNQAALNYMLSTPVTFDFKQNLFYKINLSYSHIYKLQKTNQISREQADNNPPELGNHKQYKGMHGDDNEKEIERHIKVLQLIYYIYSAVILSPFSYIDINDSTLLYLIMGLGQEMTAVQDFIVTIVGNELQGIKVLSMSKLFMSAAFSIIFLGLSVIFELRYQKKKYLMLKLVCGFPNESLLEFGDEITERYIKFEQNSRNLQGQQNQIVSTSENTTGKKDIHEYDWIRYRRDGEQQLKRKRKHFLILSNPQILQWKTVIWSIFAAILVNITPFLSYLSQKQFLTSQRTIIQEKQYIMNALQQLTLNIPFSAHLTFNGYNDLFAVQVKKMSNQQGKQIFRLMNAVSQPEIFTHSESYLNIMRVSICDQLSEKEKSSLLGCERQIDRGFIGTALHLFKISKILFSENSDEITLFQKEILLRELEEGVELLKQAAKMLISHQDNTITIVYQNAMTFNSILLIIQLLALLIMGLVIYNMVFKHHQSRFEKIKTTLTAFPMLILFQNSLLKAFFMKY